MAVIRFSPNAAPWHSLSVGRTLQETLLGKAEWHVRRRFFELAAAGPAPTAREAVQRIAQLYQIETEIRGRIAETRRATRQEQSRPILEAFEPWLRESSP
jgi:hypothetical protein